MTNLKSINFGFNKYCGPAVLSALTGYNTDECARVISKINGSYDVTGVQTSHLIQAANQLGYEASKIETNCSLYRAIMMLSDVDGIYLIGLPKHFAIIEVNQKQVYFCDNHTKEPMRAASSARLMQNCEYVYKFTKVKEVNLRPLSTEITLDVKVWSVTEKVHVEVSRTYTSKYEDHEDVRNEFMAAFPCKSQEEFNHLIDELFKYRS